MQNTVLERGFDVLTVDVFGKRERPLVVAVRILGIDPLIVGVIRGGASSADRQQTPLEGDIHSVESDTRHLGEHDDAIARLIDVGGRQEHLPRGGSLPGFCRLQRSLLRQF
jgi:hypothetical protein